MATAVLEMLIDVLAHMAIGDAVGIVSVRPELQISGLSIYA
ncbi:hypothetical protein [Candidatus Poriferisodalis sp.]